MIFKTLKRILYALRLSRLRGVFWNLRYRTGSFKTNIHRPLFITPKYLRLSEGVCIYKNCRIEGVTNYLGNKYNPRIVFGRNVTVNQNLHLTCADQICIGENTAIATNVTITDIDHPYKDVSIPVERQILDVHPVSIGKDCKIYNNVVILPGVTIGRHCVIGANSVVTKDIPDYCVAVGAPAKVVKRYDFEKGEWVKV